MPNATDSPFPTAAVLAAAVTIVIWTLTRLYEFVEKQKTAKSDEQKYIIALFAEIDFNTRDMEIFASESASIDAVVAKVRSQQDFIPHITDARHTFIYAEGLSNIHRIGKQQIGLLVYFYGLLEKLKNQVAGIYLPSFGKISPEGREATIREIVETASKIGDVGQNILEELQDKYPRYRLVRTERSKSMTGLTIQQLKARRDALVSDLDRVNAKHKSAPC